MKYRSEKLNRRAVLLRIIGTIVVLWCFACAVILDPRYIIECTLGFFFWVWSYSLGEWDDPVSQAHFSFTDEPTSGQEVVFVDEDLRPIGGGVYLLRGEWDITWGTEDGAKYWRPV